MIETVESRAEFERHRALAVATFKKKINGELALDAQPITNEIKKRVEAESDLAKVEVKPKKNRASYMREYRSRPKKCPYCGKQI